MQVTMRASVMTDHKVGHIVLPNRLVVRSGEAEIIREFELAFNVVPKLQAAPTTGLLTRKKVTQRIMIGDADWIPSPDISDICVKWESPLNVVTSRPDEEDVLAAEQFHSRWKPWATLIVETTPPQFKDNQRFRHITACVRDESLVIPVFIDFPASKLIKVVPDRLFITSGESSPSPILRTLVINYLQPTTTVRFDTSHAAISIEEIRSNSTFYICQVSIGKLAS
jgi:hypothetical protein